MVPKMPCTVIHTLRILQHIRFNAFAFGIVKSSEISKSPKKMNHDIRWNHRWIAFFGPNLNAICFGSGCFNMLSLIACETQTNHTSLGGGNASNECRSIVATLGHPGHCGGARPCTLTPPYDLKFSKTICRIISRGTGPWQ